MNKVVEEMLLYLGSSKNDELMHVGRSKKDGAPGPGSGRYPLGSGEDPYQHDLDFLERVESLKKKGWKNTADNIMKEFGLTTSQYREEISICNNTRRMALVSRAKELKEKGLNTTEIGREMGVNESSVRSWLNKESESKMLKTKETHDRLKKEVDSKRMIDVGTGVEIELGISKEKMNTALKMLEKEGYHVYSGRMPQPTNKNQMTTLKVLGTPDVQHKEIFDYEKIKTINDYVSKDGGMSFEKKFTYPSSLDSKRLMVRYKEDGGIDKDGVIELRRNVPDLSLGNSKYSQVRILVDGTHYLKGMAVYSDDMPDGIDVVFNTNKKRGTPVCGTKVTGTVLKEIKKDPENPFGSNIKDADLGGQYWYTDKNGKKKLGLINKRADEGDWTEWKDALPSQFLSKQSKSLVEKQLNLAKVNKLAEFDTINSLNNPTIKKYYLKKFADGCDAAAADLKAAALPGQKYHVIIPINAMGDNKIHAPKYENGTKLALIRYPHGGIFEIPILTVDNNNPVAEKILGKDAEDAVGISAKVAERLSGADFDGDTVMCIPTHDIKGKVKIASSNELEGLKGFDNKLSYGPDKIYVGKDGKTHYSRAGHDYPIMKNTDNEMGQISNLITDMTLQGANREELARAVRHSMVVIDAEKHKLDYKQSYIDNDIKTLKRIYQPKFDSNGNIIRGGGASTIISRSKGPQKVPKRKGQPKVNLKNKPWYDPKRPEGSLIYTIAPDEELYYAESKYDKRTGMRTITLKNGHKISYNMNNRVEREKYDPIISKSKNGDVEYISKDGSLKYRTIARTTDSNRMNETDDAYSLISERKHPIEILYADYANSMKELANKARVEIAYSNDLVYNREAAKIYKNEVSALEVKLNNAMKNKVKERVALRRANVEIQNKLKLDPDLKPDDIKKLSQRSVSKYREEVNSIPRRKRSIDITDKEWEAIQAGAISNNKLKMILENSDPDILRERAMPKDRKTLNSIQITRIKTMAASNFTLAEIAKKMGISPTTVSSYLKGANK